MSKRDVISAIQRQVVVSLAFFSKTEMESETGPIEECSILPHRHPHALTDGGLRRHNLFLLLFPFSLPTYI